MCHVIPLWWELRSAGHAIYSMYAWWSHTVPSQLLYVWWAFWYNTFVKLESRRSTSRTHLKPIQSLLLKNTTPNCSKILLQSVPIQRDMRQDSMTSRDKPSYTHGIAVILSPILSSLHFIRDTWLECEGSRVRNRDKTSWLLLLLLSSFIHPLPSHIRTPNVLGLLFKTWSHSALILQHGISF